MGVFFNINKRWEDTVISTDQIYSHQAAKPRDLGLSICHLDCRRELFPGEEEAFLKTSSLNLSDARKYHKLLTSIKINLTFP